MGEILFFSNHQKVLVVLSIQKSVQFEDSAYLYRVTCSAGTFIYDQIDTSIFIKFVMTEGFFRFTFLISLNYIMIQFNSIT